MANEITIQLAMALKRGTVTYINKDLGSVSLTQTGSRSVHQTLLANTTGVAIPASQIGTLGYLMAINRDTVASVNLLATGSGVIFGTIGPGDVLGPIKLGSGVTAPTLQVVGTTGTALIEYILLEL